MKFILLFVLWLSPAALSALAFTHRIDSQEAFLSLSKELDQERFTKFVVDLTTDEIYYVNSNEYELHTMFVFDELLKCDLTPILHREFNKNYSENKPKYLLCSLEHHLQQDIWTFSFWEGDRANVWHIEKAYKKLQETFYLANIVQFQTHSNSQERVASQLALLPYVTSDTLYRTSDYKPFFCAKSVGRLRLVSNPEDDSVFIPGEIVVLASALPDITPVAGIITEQFSTPLSHLALRARAWGIPHIGLKNAVSLLQPYDGHYVFFSADRSGYEIRLATAEEIAGAEQKEPHAQVVTIPKADLTRQPLAKIATIESVYGTKAAMLGKVKKLLEGRFKVPESFSIPFYYYAEHLKNSGVEAKLKELLQQTAFKTDRNYRKSKLEAIRQAFVAFPLSKSFLDECYREMQELTVKGVFVRSSTNAEDLKGFTGAGLYDTVANVKDKKALEEAIKKVWASVWNLKAYEERQRFGIDHLHVFAGCLVQEGIQATAAGVLITKNVLDPEETMEVYTINAKRGLGEGVVSGANIPEQILFNYDNGGIKVLSRSNDREMIVFDEQGGTAVVPNPYPDAPILSEAMAIELANSAYFLKRSLSQLAPLDIEWLFLDRELYILQVRPY